MSPRTGRPKADNPKSERITVRLNKDDAQFLLEYCAQENVDRAEAIRRGIQKLRSKAKE